MHVTRERVLRAIALLNEGRSWMEVSKLVRISERQLRYEVTRERDQKEVEAALEQRLPDKPPE